MTTRTPAVGRISATVAPSLMTSMRLAVSKGIARISQATSNNTKIGVADSWATCSFEWMQQAY